MSNNGDAPPIFPPSPPEKLSGTFELPGAEAEPPHYAHCTGPEAASGKIPVSGRIIIASNLLPWELSFGKDANWVGTCSSQPLCKLTIPSLPN